MTPVRNTLLERPLAARSVIASLLLGSHPPRIAGRRLVQWCALFGIAEGTARVALSRMVERGELLAADGIYELVGRVRERQPAQDWSVRPQVRRWHGDWRVGMVSGGARPAGDRAALRDVMRRLRHAEVREGVWTRPDNLPSAAAPDDAWRVAADQCAWWTGRPDDDALALARRLFTPDAWARRARVLHKQLGRVTNAIDANEDALIADAFIVGAATLAHIRADPLLPAELCPENWPGDELRTSYRQYDQCFARAVREWFRRR